MYHRQDASGTKREKETRRVRKEIGKPEKQIVFVRVSIIDGMHM
jgi:hypothetical protein